MVNNSRYFVWKDAGCGGIDPEWIEMTGAEFYDFCQKPENSGRFFVRYDEGMDIDEDIELVFFETTEEAYWKWHTEQELIRRRKRRRKGYYRKTISLDARVTVEDSEMTMHELVASDDLSVEEKFDRTEAKARIREFISGASEAWAALNDKEKDLIIAMFLSENPMTEREYAASLGISQPAVFKRKHTILKKIKKILKF